MTQPLTIIIQANDQATATHLCHEIESSGQWRVTSVMRAPQHLFEEVQQQRPVAVLLMLGPQPQTTWTLCQQIRATSPGTTVICAAAAASPDLILDTLRNGAHEFVRLPLRREELHTVLDRIAANQTSTPAAAQGTQRGRITAVFSPKGGCGTSFLAANFAVALNARAALLDLNLHASSLDLFFGVKPRFSWVELVQNRARLDDQMLASLLVQYNERLSLLAAPAQAEDAEDITAEQLREALVTLSGHFEHLVLDVMHTFDALTLAALDEADEILLVLGLDIVAVRAAQRALTIFQRLDYPREKVRLVLNRFNQHSELELREIERALGQPISSSIPDDYRTVVASLNLGQPLLTATSNSPVGVEVQRLLTACGLPWVGELNQSKRGLMDILLRRNTSPIPAAAPPLKNTQPLPNTAPLVNRPVPPATAAPTERARTAPLRSTQVEPETTKTF